MDDMHARLDRFKAFSWIKKQKSKMNPSDHNRNSIKANAMLDMVQECLDMLDGLNKA